MDRAALDRLTPALLAAAPDWGAAAPDALTVLLHQFVATGAEELRHALETGLAVALAALDAERDAWQRMEWLGVLDAAQACAADETLAAAVRDHLPAAVDAVEAAVRRSYEPGEGLVGASYAGHLAAASALLVAFDLTGRLPYAMLAEELLLAGGPHPGAPHGRFEGETVLDCLAARVLCRMAVLQADPGYGAVVRRARPRPWEAEARRLLAGAVASCPDDVRGAAACGAALVASFALQRDLQ